MPDLDDISPDCTSCGEGAAEQELTRLRAEIDAVDTELLGLLNRRADLSLRVGALKKNSGGPVRRPERERQVLEKLSRSNYGPLSAAQLASIYESIFEVSRELQK